MFVAAAVALCVIASPLGTITGKDGSIQKISTPKPLQEYMGRMASHLGSAKADVLTKQRHASELSRKERGLQPKLIGSFVTPCESFNCIINDDPSLLIPCSITAVERIDSYGEVLTDFTFYIKDYGCRPNQTDVVLKIEMASTISYYGPGVPAPGGTSMRIAYTPHGSNFTFNYMYEVEGLIDDLNHECPCNGTWQSGVKRYVDPSKCANSTIPRNAHQYDLCNLVVGSPQYQSYIWLSNAVYAQSLGAYTEQEGWSQPVNKSLVNYKLPEGGVTTPSACDFTIAQRCLQYIDIAASACKGCAGLECEGCIFREFPEKLNEQKEYDLCCPCLYFYAQEHSGHDFLKVNC